LLGLWHAHNKIPVPCKTELPNSVVGGTLGEPNSRHTGCFVAPSYWIMAENLPYQLKLGTAESPKIATDIRHRRYLITLLPKHLFSTKIGFKKKRKKGMKEATVLFCNIAPI